MPDPSPAACRVNGLPGRNAASMSTSPSGRSWPESLQNPGQGGTILLFARLGIGRNERPMPGWLSIHTAHQRYPRDSVPAAAHAAYSPSTPASRRPSPSACHLRRSLILPPGRPPRPPSGEARRPFAQAPGRFRNWCQFPITPTLLYGATVQPANADPRRPSRTWQQVFSFHAATIGASGSLRSGPFDSDAHSG